MTATWTCRGIRRNHSEHDERGAVAIMMALCLTGLLIIGGMVLDFGLVRVDRQVDKSAADAATLAGLHGLYQNAPGVGDPHPYAGVCAAIQYLQVNGARFSGMSSSTGTWTGPISAPDPCNGSPAALNWVCQPASQSSWARFAWSGTYQGTAIQVMIQSGYKLPASGWAEDSLSAAQAFQDDGAGGCDQLAVIIGQKRQPGLGSLATTSQLVSSIRSVGRVKSEPGSSAPAMLLLKRTGCPTLQVGSAAGGSHIYVYGAYSPTTGFSEPGTIHSDSDGLGGCTGGSNSNIFLGRGTNGIVAFAAPRADGSPDPSKPGMITTTAVADGIAPTDGRITDGNAYGTTAVNSAGLPGTLQPITGRGLVTRSIIDNRYLGDSTHGVRGIVATANNVFSSMSSIGTAAQAATAGYNEYVKCSGGKITAADLPAMTSTDRLFVDCAAGVSQMAPATAGVVAFNGPIKLTGSGNSIDLPNATKVYVAGSSSDGVNMGSNAFKMHYSGNLVSGSCSNDQSPPSDRALLVIRNGGLLESTGGFFQACYTSVIMMGGQGNGCLPATPGTAPTAIPCAGTAGTGLITQQGGDTDWTAPNSVDATLDSQGNPLPGSQDAWWRTDGPEDLAFWSETYGTGPDWNMNGQGALHLVGVVMAPNADPFKIAGGACQNLVNAQYIATSILLNGNGACITMRVDPNSAVTLPQMGVVGLVR